MAGSFLVIVRELRLTGDCRSTRHLSPALVRDLGCGLPEYNVPRFVDRQDGSAGTRRVAHDTVEESRSAPPMRRRVAHIMRRKYQPAAGIRVPIDHRLHGVKILGLVKKVNGK